MAYSFDTRHDYLRRRMRAVKSRTVVYRRGSASVEVVATPYEMRDEDKINFGVPLAERRIDYIIDNDEVIAAVGNPFTGPEQNDEIVDETIGVVCKVVPMGDGQCFKYTSNVRSAMRIHALVDEEL